MVRSCGLVLQNEDDGGEDDGLVTLTRYSDDSSIEDSGPSYDGRMSDMEEALPDHVSGDMTSTRESNSCQNSLPDSLPGLTAPGSFSWESSASRSVSGPASEHGGLTQSDNGSISSPLPPSSSGSEFSADPLDVFFTQRPSYLDDTLGVPRTWEDLAVSSDHSSSGPPSLHHVLTDSDDMPDLVPGPFGGHVSAPSGASSCDMPLLEPLRTSSGNCSLDSDGTLQYGNDNDSVDSDDDVLPSSGSTLHEASGIAPMLSNGEQLHMVPTPHVASVSRCSALQMEGSVPKAMFYEAMNASEPVEDEAEQPLPQGGVDCPPSLIASSSGNVGFPTLSNEGDEKSDLHRLSDCSKQVSAASDTPQSLPDKGKDCSQDNSVDGGSADSAGFRGSDCSKREFCSRTNAVHVPHSQLEVGVSGLGMDPESCSIGHASAQQNPMSCPLSQGRNSEPLAVEEQLRSGVDCLSNACIRQNSSCCSLGHEESASSRLDANAQTMLSCAHYCPSPRVIEGLHEAGVGDGLGHCNGHGPFVKDPSDGRHLSGSQHHVPGDLFAQAASSAIADDMGTEERLIGGRLAFLGGMALMGAAAIAGILSILRAR
jgi:hypothetical protein